MKICENDGRTSHMNSFINLIKHLNNDNNYLSLKGTDFLILSQQERRQLMESGIEIRILDGDNKLMLTINSSIKDVSSFQIDAVNKVICACKTLKDSNIYNTVEIGCFISDCRVEFDELSDEHFNNLLDGLEMLKSNIKNK